jgi:hypothetical protein
MTVTTQFQDVRSRFLGRGGDLFEQGPEPDGVGASQSGGDFLLDLLDQDVGLAKKLAAGVREMELLHMAMAGMRPAFQLAPALEAVRQRGHGLRLWLLSLTAFAATAGTVTTLVAGPAGFNALPGAFASLAVVTILYAVDRVAVRRMER